ncbi:MAG: hypothetical protein CMJ18_05110, partial [Phycisphaeraceae bacterium]|nr:hypothetical protein [Phycisphaeraceae bacterium]
GGGGVPKRINDSQWRIMQRYYKDQHSVEGYLYLALRAPTDKWNGFYTGYVFPIVDNLIRQFLLFGDVDPDRVHAMGYSHGGYGAFAIGPTMADRFGSVHSSAAAPTGGLTFAENLRNTRFTYMIGERDTAHGRQSRCLSFDQQITKLRGDMKDAFPVTLEFIKNHGHGGLPDRDKIKDMYPHVRKVSPTRLSWRPTYVKGHFWLRVPDAGGGQTIEAVRDGNKFKITTAEKTPVVDLMLDSRIVDFSREVTVVCNGKERVHEIKPALSTYCSTLIGRGDPMLAAPAWVRVVVE